MWKLFLSDTDESSFCRPMIDIRQLELAECINFATDSSGNSELGFGGVYESAWFFGQWEPGFIKEKCPSIVYLELFALTAGVLI